MAGYPYLSHYYTTLLEREKSKFSNFPWLGQSPQLEERKDLLDTLTLTAENFKLQTTTVHLAVFLLDTFMDRHVIEKCYLQLLSLACLFIAAKYKERDSRLPHLKDLLHFMNLDVTKCQYRAMEMLILNSVQWELGVPSVIDFVELFVQKDVCGTSKNKRRAKEIQSRAIEIANVTLEVPFFHNLHSSFVAAACVAGARLKAGVHPDQNADLEQWTGYTADSIQQCLPELLGYYEYYCNADKSSSYKNN